MVFVMRSFLRLILIGVLLVVPALVWAQEPGPFGNRDARRPSAEGDVYQPPAVFVNGAQVQVNNSQVQGSFEIFNGDQETVGDLHYRIDLLSPPPAAEVNQLIQDAPEIYDQALNNEIFAVIPGERKTVLFTYTPPRVPKGDYRLRFQLVTSKGRELGWHDTTVNLGGEGVSFVRILPGTIGLPEFPEELIPPQSGPNVAPGSAFTIHATFQNIGKETVIARPVLERYKFDIARGREEKITLGEPVTLAAGESQEVSFPVTAPAKPEVYVAILSLEDPATNTRISNQAEYRWVVRGLDADIVSARIASLRQRKGEIVDVQVDIVGPADAETIHTGTLLVELTDSQGTVGSVREENLELTDALQSGMARVVLERDLVGAPGITVTLLDQAGNVLDVYEVAVPLSDSQIAELVRLAGQVPTAGKLPLGVWVGAAVAAVGVITLIIWLIIFALKKRHFPSLPSGPVAFFIIVSGLITSGVSLAANGITVNLAGPTVQELCQTYRGDWCRVGGQYITELFINSPVHENTYASATAVPISYRVDWVACKNTWTYTRNVIRYSPEGAIHTSWPPPPGTSWHNLVEIGHSQGPGGCRLYWCQVSRHFDGVLNLSQLPPTAGKTTLQIMSIFEWFQLPPPWSETLYNVVSQPPYAVHAVNVWLNFPTSTPSVTSSPAASPTGSPPTSPTGSPGTSPSSSPTGSPGASPTATSTFDPGGVKEID